MVFEPFMPAKIFFCPLFFLISIFSFAQAPVKGRVVDKQGKSLPFVSIAVPATSSGTVSDIDGKFELNIPDEDLKKGLLFNYVGYEPLNLSLEGKDLLHLSVTLKSKDIQLAEVTVLPGLNPAHRIIEQVTTNRKINNPEKMHSFSYTSYNKMFVTNETDVNQDSLMLLDTSRLDKVQKFFKRQHLFLTESVSERLYLYPDKNNEKVIASRVSGFKLSPFTLLATQMQSFSFYDDLLNLFDVKYLNPVSEGSTKKYFFLIEDTLYQGKDSVYVISFRPRKNKNFNSLSGLLYINTNTYAIQNVIAEPAMQDKNINVKIQQQYQFVENKQWFPVQLNTDWIYNNIQVSDSGSQSKPKIKSISRTYIRNIVLNPELKKKQFNEVELSIDKNADQQADVFWNQYRTDSLTVKDKNTYKTIDSIGKAMNLDKKAIALEALLTNQLQVKCVNIDLDQLLRLNDYEGYRLGIGAHTNQRISTVFKTGGYVAYGFKDKTLKYGGDFSLSLWKRKEVMWKNTYMNDVIESAGVKFFENKQLLNNSEMYRDFLVAKMDRMIKLQSEIQFRMLKYIKTNVFLNHQQRWGNTGYLPDIHLNSSPKDTVNFNEAGIQIKYLFREKFMQTLRNKISMGSDYPVVYLNISKGLKQDVFQQKGDLDYTRIDLKIELSHTYKSMGKSTVQLQTGKVRGNVPYTLLYNNKGNYSNAYPFSTSAQNTFETMRMNEFVSDEYAALFFSHNIGKFLKPNKTFNPQLELVHNMGIGKYTNQGNNYFIALKTMEKGYFESGIRLLNILKSSTGGFGLGVFYRYGPYQYSKPEDNLAIKLCVSFGL